MADTYEDVGRSAWVNNVDRPAYERHRHYLKGSVFCGQCRHRLTIMNARSPTGTIYPYFFCLGRQEDYSECTQSVVLIDRVELAVEQHYKTVPSCPRAR